MKHIKTVIAVLATAALSMVAINAADSYSPDSTVAPGISVRVNPTTGVQVYPASYRILRGYDSTNSTTLTATGTNFVVAPVAPYQLVTAAGKVNLISASSTSATTGWETVIAIKGAATADYGLTYPAGWAWPTNQTLALTGTNVLSSSKISSIVSNTIVVLRINAVGTNVLVGGQVFRP